MRVGLRPRALTRQGHLCAELPSPPVWGDSATPEGSRDHTCFAGGHTHNWEGFLEEVGWRGAWRSSEHVRS